MPPPIPVVLVPHDPRWPALAESEAARFASALAPDAIETVHHIGSTSIAGIRAKPILDLLPVVHDLASLDAAGARLEALGYLAWGEYGLPGRRFFTRDHDGARVANVHAYAAGSPEITRHLAFRDYVRAHPAVAQAYDEEKARARALHPGDSYAYSDEKGAFVKRTEADALAWARARA